VKAGESGKLGWLLSEVWQPFFTQLFAPDRAVAPISPSEITPASQISLDARGAIVVIQLVGK